MSAALSRRGLFNRFRGGPAQLRPPWSRGERIFTDACTQCGKCLAACPARIVVKGHAGYPIVDFARGACTFCGACADACGEGCFARTDGGRPWMLRAVISAACVEPKGVACRVCQEACAPSAIRFRPMLGGRSQPLIDPDRCTGCGECIAPCPVKAVSISDTMPLEATA